MQQITKIRKMYKLQLNWRPMTFDRIETIFLNTNPIVLRIRLFIPVPKAGIWKKRENPQPEKMFIGVIAKSDDIITGTIIDKQIIIGNHPFKLKCWNDAKEKSPIAAPTKEVKLNKFRPIMSMKLVKWR